MKICLFSPYMPHHKGGGEKYLLDVARVLGRKYPVVIGLSGRELTRDRATSIKREYEAFLGQELTNIEFIATPLGTKASFWEKLHWTRQFDVLYYVTDGSLFFSAAKKNILHIQIPFTDAKNSVVDRLKLANWSVKNTNSEFTKSVIEQHWKTKISVVHQPMIERVDQPDLRAKKPVILHVGRFFRQLHSKRQDVLVDIFRQLIKTHPESLQGWQLVLIGGVEDPAYAQEVELAARGLPIKLLHTVSRESLNTWYNQASIYWHATGYGQDEQLHPERMEHFGISTVEAMAHGCAPVVIGRGGQVEVVGKELRQWTWQSPEECVDKTAQLIENAQERQRVQTDAIKRATSFDETTFERKLWSMIGR